MYKNKVELETGLSLPVALVPLLVHFGGGSAQLAAWSAVIVLTAIGYGHLFQSLLGSEVAPAIILCLGLVIVVFGIVTLVLIGVGPVSVYLTIIGGLATLTIKLNHIRKSSLIRVNRLQKCRISLVCLAAMALLLVDHSPAWGLLLAVCLIAAVLSLVPSHRLHLLILLAVVVILSLRVGSPVKGFFLISDDITFTEAFSHLVLRYGPHEWYGVLDVAVPYHWFGFGLLGVFGLGAKSSDLYPTALLAQVLVSTFLPWTLKDVIRIYRPNSQYAFGLLVLIVIAAPFSYEFSPSTTISILLFTTIFGFIKCIDARSSLRYSSIGLFLLSFAATSSKATMLLSLPFLIATTGFLQTPRKVRMYMSISIIGGFVASLHMTYDILNHWSFEDYGLSFSILGGVGSISDLGVQFSVIGLLAVGLIGADFRLGIVAVVIGVFSFYVQNGTLTPQSHYFFWTTLWIVLIVTVIPLSRLKSCHYIIALIFSATISFFSHVIVNSWTIYRWSERFPNLPREVPRWFFLIFLTASLGALSLAVISWIRPKWQRGHQQITIGGVALLSLLLLLALGQASLLLDRWRHLGSDFTTTIDMETPRRLREKVNLQEAGLWIRENSSPSAIVATNYLCDIGSNDADCDLDGESPVAALTRRRTLLEAPRFAAGLLSEPPLNESLEVAYPEKILASYRTTLLLGSNSPLEAMQLLQERGVTHYLEYFNGPGNMALLQGTEIFSNAEFRVVRIVDP